MENYTLWLLGFFFVLLLYENKVYASHRFLQPDATREAKQLSGTSYHFQAPKNWLNGPMYYKGIYHLFYQHNPYGAVFGKTIVWGHSVSYDLINWIHLNNALSPTNAFDAKSCWSGSITILPGQKPVVLYTGLDVNNQQVQNMAMPKNEVLRSVTSLSNVALTDIYYPNLFAAINSLYVALGSPLLPGWVGVGVDPCADGWQGIQCIDSNITSIIFNAANLGEELGDNLGLFASIRSIDFSGNQIGGNIPSSLPVTLQNLYAMRVIYIAKGSPLLTPAFASIFDDSASSSLDVFFYPSSGLINLPGLTIGLVSTCFSLLTTMTVQLHLYFFPKRSIRHKKP